MCELCTFSQIWSHYVLMHFTLLQKNPLNHYKEFYKNWSISSRMIILVVLHLLAYTRIIRCSVSTHIQLCFLFFDKPVDFSCWSLFSSSSLLYNCSIKLSIRWSFSSVSLLTNLQFVHIILNLCFHVHLHTGKDIHMYTHRYTHLHSDTHTHMYTHTPIHIDTHTYMQTHTYM